MIGTGLESIGLERRGGHWKIAQFVYLRMPEQSGGGCSDIQRVRHPADAGAVWGCSDSLRARHPDPGTFRRPPAVVQHDAAPAARSIYLPAQGPGR